MLVYTTKIMINLEQKSFITEKVSRYPEDSKLVRQVHVVQKIPPGSMIEQKNFFCKNTIFVKKIFYKIFLLAFVIFM